MHYDEYVSKMADLLSGDPQRVAEANEELYHELVDEGEKHHALALIDIENKLDQEAKAKAAAAAEA